MIHLSLEKISKSFDSAHGGSSKVKVLDQISLNIEHGEFFFLLGPSGCGKTTLLRLIAGLAEPDSGSIVLDGRNLLGVPPHQRGIGLVFQNYALWPHLTVRKNVSFGLEMSGFSQSEIQERTEQALAMVRISQMSQRFPHELSGGQQQRVALARALAIRPRVLLLDEPLSNLDSKLRSEMRQELLQLHQETGITMIYVTHDQGEALALGTRIAILNQGQVEQLATPRVLVESPATPFVKEFLGELSIVHGAYQQLGNKAQISVTGGTIPYSGQVTKSEGSSATVALRPEGVVIIRE